MIHNVKDIESAVGEATKIRSAESKRNAATVKDAKAAMKAIDAAIGILKDFYMKALDVFVWELRCLIRFFLFHCISCYVMISESSFN